MNLNKFDFGENLNSAPQAFEKVPICHLSHSPSFPIVYGVVINKSAPKAVATKNTGVRWVMNFTIRDSPFDTVNAACWGNEGQIKPIASSFAIGDVVEIKNPRILENRGNLGNEKFKPRTTSNVILNISVRDSTILVCNGAEAMEYAGFIHCPIYTLSNYSSLAEIIHTCPNDDDGICANLLVAIKQIGLPQDITMKDGKLKRKLEIIVFDQTVSYFPVLIWEDEIINFIQKFITIRSVLLISDVRLSFNKFVKSITATAIGSTVFTPDPDIPDARILYQFAQIASIDEGISGTQIDNGSKQLYTVHQILELMYRGHLSPFVDIEGIVFAYISHLDLDGTTKITSLRCAQCKQFVKTSDAHCQNGNCTVGSGFENKAPQEVFDFIINLTDHTGTLRSCTVFDPVLQELLKCSANQFQNFSDQKKTEIKWQHLLERYKIEFKIPQSSVALGKPLIRIMSFTKADPEEVNSLRKHLF